MQIMNSILQVGRSAHISCIVSRHHLNTGQHTKVILNEANKIVIFPNGLSHYNIKYCLTNYIGFDKYQIDKILKNRSRWVQISTRMPRYIITETSVELI